MISDKVGSKMLFFSKISKELYEQIIEKKAKECGISKQEANVLLFFSNNKEFDKATDAVTYRGFSKAYVSKALATLIKRDFVEVYCDSIDKRYQRIIILDKANPVLSVLKEAQRDYFLSLSEGISDEEFLIHAKIIDKIAENIKNKMKG